MSLLYSPSGLYDKAKDMMRNSWSLEVKGCKEVSFAATMTNKILAICQLEQDLVQKYSSVIHYHPLSNEETDTSWRTLIETFEPKAIVFGLQTINEEKLAFWRQHQPNDRLQFVRKGTSLHRVDFEAAKKHDIEVHNTAGVNASFVAQFVIDTLQEKTSPIGIVGVGAIGQKAALTLLQSNKTVLLFNRSQHFDSASYCDLGYLFKNAPQVVICLPLTELTKGIITEKLVEDLPLNGQVICISPPRVFSKEAIVALDRRMDIDVTFDHVASGLAHIHESLGRTTLRKGFIFEEKAAAGHDCQYAMGESAICKAMNN